MNKNSVYIDEPLTYRITGPQSIDRLEPLLKGLEPFRWTSIDDVKLDETRTSSPIDFIWETTFKLTERNTHIEAIILNKLHNSLIIEDKSNLAFLQIRMLSDSIGEEKSISNSNHSSVHGVLEIHYSYAYSRIALSSLCLYVRQGTTITTIP